MSEAPKLLYINENGEGCGEVYIDGVKVESLQTVHIKAQTNKEIINPLKYEIKMFNKETHQTEVKEKGSFNNMEIKVKLTNIELFKSLVDLFKETLANKDISMEIRNEMDNKLNAILEVARNK